MALRVTERARSLAPRPMADGSVANPQVIADAHETRLRLDAMRAYSEFVSRMDALEAWRMRGGKA